jgi:hypothetical protein
MTTATTKKMHPAFGEWMADRNVEALVREWDMVSCARCGKKISMLTAKHDKDCSKFYCPKGCSHQ